MALGWREIFLRGPPKIILDVQATETRTPLQEIRNGLTGRTERGCPKQTPSKLGMIQSAFLEMAIYINIDLLMFQNLTIETILYACLTLNPHLTSDMSLQDLSGTIEEAVAHNLLALPQLRIPIRLIDLRSEMSVKRRNLQILMLTHYHAQRTSQRGQEETDPLIPQRVITVMAKTRDHRTRHQRQTRPMAG
ncbi:conserved hypothetical protein [Histoplasma capsulatum H143]|uniref:Uncharacterized protein n=1 Tax=Ajellomyces capsulatus (strain H143) TaxID=544712 RepID=C6HSN8_AJECH|nr:conserved hypothetical protein [Histoplasma capsulatum H143]